MKKITVFLSILSLLGLSSCEKRYTCHCETSVGDEHVYVNATSKKKAETACADAATANNYHHCGLD